MKTMSPFPGRRRGMKMEEKRESPRHERMESEVVTPPKRKRGRPRKER